MSRPWTILFDAYHLYHLPQFQPVIDLMQGDPRFRLVLSTASAAVNPAAELAITRAACARQGLEGIFSEDEPERVRRLRELDPDVFLCGTTRYHSGWPKREWPETFPRYITERALAGCLFHGIGVKPAYWRDHHARLDVRFVEGPYRERQLRQHGVKSQLPVCGFAKLDPLFRGELPAARDRLRELGLDPARPTLLYAPTFYPSSLPGFGRDFGRLTAGWNVLVKLHMWTHLRDYLWVAQKPMRELAEGWARAHPHIRLLPADAYDITPWLAVADVLLTEASSTIYEMLAADKPVVLAQFYHLKLSHRLFRSRLYRRRLSEEMAAEAAEVCVPLARPEDLPRALEQARALRPATFPRVRALLDDMIHPRDGRAAERVRDWLVAKLS